MGDVYNIDITSANAELVLAAEEVFPAGIALQMFSTDQSYSAEAQTMAETRMGVDGHIAAGYVPSEKVVTITLEAASPSYPFLAELATAMETNRKVYRCTLLATLPAIGRTLIWSVGVLYSGTRVPAGAKTLQPTTWTFHFEQFAETEII